MTLAAVALGFAVILIGFGLILLGYQRAMDAIECILNGKPWSGGLRFAAWITFSVGAGFLAAAPFVYFT